MPESVVYHAFEETLQYWKDEGGGMAQGSVEFYPEMWARGRVQVSLHHRGGGPLESIPHTQMTTGICPSLDHILLGAAGCGECYPKLTRKHVEETSLKNPERWAFEAYNKRLGRYLNSAAVQRDMQGPIISCARGKELVIGVGHYFLRVWFGLEGHVWALPWDALRIVEKCPIVKPEDKSLGALQLSLTTLKEMGISSLIPQGQRNEDCRSWQTHPLKVTMAMAFVQNKNGRSGSSRGSYAFLDHLGLMRIHIMRKKSPVAEADFKVGSEVWPYLWTKGPVASDQLERDESGILGRCLDEWRQFFARSSSIQWIQDAIQSNQDVFNGYGRQETTDALAYARIPPFLPAAVVCQSDDLFHRLKQQIVGSKDLPPYSVRQRLSIDALQMGIIGGDYPDFWSFQEERHRLFLETVSTYRRRRVILKRSNGNVQPLSLPNYRLVRTSTSKTVSYYSPYAHDRECLETWLNPGEKLEIELYTEDVGEVENKTTIGPMSFRVLQCVRWTQEHTRWTSSSTQVKKLKKRKANNRLKSKVLKARTRTRARA